MKDEAEIRGHRRTYVGAMPGRIIQGIHQAGSCNPVFVLDEVDKIGADYRGDPSSALLEVLDPEQNNTFRDHYLGVAWDLSDVMFITTANLLDPIQPAFRDRMEVIRISGYTEEEKLEIAQRHLIPRQVDDNGLRDEQIEFSENATRRLIAEYTRRPGCGISSARIGSVCRKVARQVAEGSERSVRIIASSLEGYLGPAPASREEAMAHDQVGTATGLAWTQAGGDVLFIEATTMEGRGQLILTGQLGDVMKESAQAALSYARARAVRVRDPVGLLRKPRHAHPRSGRRDPQGRPFGGITMATAMLSAFTDRPVRSGARRDDRRDHAAGQRASRGWHQGQGARSTSLRRQDGDPAEIEQEESRGDPEGATAATSSSTSSVTSARCSTSPLAPPRSRPRSVSNRTRSSRRPATTQAARATSRPSSTDTSIESKTCTRPRETGAALRLGNRSLTRFRGTSVFQRIYGDAVDVLVIRGLTWR